MEIWKSQEVMDLYIRLSHFLHQYISAALNQFLQSIISKYEYFQTIQMSFMMTYLQSKYQYTLIIIIKIIQILLF